MKRSEHEKNRFQKFSVITFCFVRLLLLGDFSLLLLFIIQLLVHNSQKENFFHLNLIQFKYRHLVFRFVLHRLVRFLKFLLKLGSKKKWTKQNDLFREKNPNLFHFISFLILDFVCWGHKSSPICSLFFFGFFFFCQRFFFSRVYHVEQHEIIEWKFLTTTTTTIIRILTQTPCNNKRRRQWEKN